LDPNSIEEALVGAVRCAGCIAVIAVVSGCGSHPVYQDEKFAEKTPYSRKVDGSGESVCWSVKRAFLTQGYMLERSSDPAIVTGSYNWTYAAQYRNAENVLILRGHPELARAYLANWERHAASASQFGDAGAASH